MLINNPFKYKSAMKRVLYNIVGLMVLSTIILLSLNYVADKPNTSKNGFERKPLVNSFVKEAELFLPKEVTYISNLNADTVFLQTRTPGLIYFTSDFKNVDTVRVDIPGDIKADKVFYSKIAYPYVYILFGNRKKALIANLINNTRTVLNVPVPGPFKTPVWIDDHTIILRCIDTITYNAAFYKIDLFAGTSEVEKNLSKPLGDAGFTQDGLLRQDNLSGDLCYMEFYTNSITIFDTCLQKLDIKSHTIDTVTVAGMRIRTSATNITHSEPPKVINGLSAVNDGRLFVRSYLKADNDMGLSGVVPIDRYNLIKGNYEGTYYLTDVDRKRLTSFEVKDETMYCLFENKIIKMTIK